jgi:hypothetical protein
VARTLINPGKPGGTGHCWLKYIAPRETSEDRCISRVKRCVDAGGSGGAVNRRFDLEFQCQERQALAALSSFSHGAAPACLIIERACGSRAAKTRADR